MKVETSTTTFCMSYVHTVYIVGAKRSVIDIRKLKKNICGAKSQKVFNSLSGEKAGFFFKKGVCLYRNYKKSSIVQREELQKEFDCCVTRMSNGNQIMQQGNV